MGDPSAATDNETADRLAVTPTPAAVRFSQMVAAKPPAPVVMATATLK